MKLSKDSFDVETVLARIKTEKKKSPGFRRGSNSPTFKIISPAVYIIRFFGLAPYEFVDDRLAGSKVYLIPTLVFCLIYCNVMYSVYVKFAGLGRTRPVLGVTETVKVIFNFFVAIHDLGHAALTRGKFAQIWNSLESNDEKIRQLGFEGSDKEATFNVWAMIILNVAIWTTVNQAGMKAFAEQWAYNVGYMSIYVGTCVAVYKFVGIVYVLGQRLRRLNELAEDNIPRQPFAKVFPSNVDIKTLRSLYDDLMTVGEDLDSLFSCSLLLWLANLTLHSVSNLYFIIDWLFNNNFERSAWPIISCLLAWLTAFISQILLLHIACDYPAREAKAFNCTMVNWQVQLSKSGKDFQMHSLLHLLNRKLSFSAAGCFEVNLKLLSSIGALLTTYLVLLIQFPD